jgi:hypothetical protein
VRRLLAGFLVPLLAMACATQRGPLPVPETLLQEDPFDARYKVHCDEASGKTVCVMTGNALRPFSPRYPLLALGVGSEQRRDGAVRYFLRTVFVNETRWLNIARGRSLSLIIDGETVELDGDGSERSRYVGNGNKLYEVALFDASAALVQRIADARAVAVRLRGDFLLEKTFGNVNSLYFRQFVQHYIKNSPTPEK